MLLHLRQHGIRKKNVNSTPGIPSGYQKYKGLAGLSKKVGMESM